MMPIEFLYVWRLRAGFPESSRRTLMDFIRRQEAKERGIRQNEKAYA